MCENLKLDPAGSASGGPFARLSCHLVFKQVLCSVNMYLLGHSESTKQNLNPGIGWLGANKKVPLIAPVFLFGTYKMFTFSLVFF